MNKAETEQPQMNGGEIRALAELPQGLAIIKMENDSMMSAAAARPRSYDDIKARFMQQVAAFPAFARKAMYAKPVGKDRGGQMKYARGLSVYAAEALAEACGYNRIVTSIEPDGQDGAKVSASYTDFQGGRIRHYTVHVGMTYKRANGSIGRHSPDRFWNTVCKAELSKCVRECILRTVPPGLCAELEDFVTKQVATLLDETTVKQMVAQFSSKGVSEEMLAGLIGKPLAAFNIEDRTTLAGIWTSIEQEDVTVAEAFGELAVESTTSQEGSAGERVARSVRAAQADSATPTSKDSLQVAPAGPAEPQVNPAVPEVTPADGAPAAKFDRDEYIQRLGDVVGELTDAAASKLRTRFNMPSLTDGDSLRKLNDDDLRSLTMSAETRTRKGK